MDGQFVRPADKLRPPRPPLITPSASPPVSRIRDKPPVAKRPRLSATPSASSSVQRSFSVATVSDAERLRLESLDRLFKTWDQLADRYHKPLDEDDIVDLRDLSILKDRGVTRRTARAYAIGSMTVPTDDASSQTGDDDNAAEEEEEESADELDLISDAPVPPVPEEYKTWYVPPADQTNPEDAEMFREFEEAEKEMRARYGSEGDEESEAAPDRSAENELPQEGYEKDDLVVENDKEEPSSPPIPEPSLQRRRSRPPPKTSGDESSEDEFAAWDFNETPIPPRRTVLSAAANDDDIIDLTESPAPSPPKQKSNHQERGGWRSHSPQSQSRIRSHVRSNSNAPVPISAEKRDQTPEIEHSPADEQQAMQLLTPPRSSLTVADIPSVHDPERTPSPPPPAETPSPKFPKPRARYTPRPRTPSDDEEDEVPMPPQPSSLALKIGPPRGVKSRTSKGRRLVPEVVITIPPRKPNGKSVSAGLPSPKPPSSPSPTSKSKKGKGKENVVSKPPPSTESAPQPSRRRRSQSQPRASTRGSDSPQPPPPSRGTKRRRVSSLSSLSDSSPPRPVTPDPVSVPQSASRNKRLTRSGSSKSGYSSDIPPPTSSPVHSDADHDDAGARRAGRSHSRPKSVAPHMPPFPYPPPMYPPYTPQHDNRSSANSHHQRPDERHTTPYSASGLQDPQAQLMFAHAWHSLSYLMASGAIPAPPLPGAGYPPGLPFPPAPWPPYTPSHQRHHTHPFDTPSSVSEAGPSRPSMYSTPTHHPHPYPYSYAPMYSNGTLPPSSPNPSSPATSSPVLRPASVPPGQRSRSRGRHVSFKLDENNRPLPPTPGHPRDLPDDNPSAANRAGPSRTSKGKEKGKGKARAEPEPEPEPERREDEESSDDDEPPTRPPRGRMLQRASTPAPPPERKKSVPAGSSSTGTSSKGASKTPRSAKRKN